jgi:Domain of unknown function (DUF3576)
MTRVRFAQLALGFALVISLAACANSRPNPTAPNYSFEPGPNTGSMLGDEGMSFLFGDKNKRGQGGGAGGGGIGVNAYLWRGALDTLGFMPLSSADPFGGVIITDWYTPQSSSNERFKATAYILTKDLRSDGVKVTIFRQVLQGNHWVDAPVSQLTVSEIENKVLDRARRLREQMQAST